MGQKRFKHLCDTTQIDARASTRFTHHHACPMDNGWGPVSPYLETFRSKPPSEAHSLTVSHPDSTIRDSLKSDVRQLLFFFTGFSCITLLVLYALRGGFVNSFLTETVDNYSAQLLRPFSPVGGRDGAAETGGCPSSCAAQA